jgi:hypothetical protein
MLIQRRKVFLCMDAKIGTTLLSLDTFLIFYGRIFLLLIIISVISA